MSSPGIHRFAAIAVSIAALGAPGDPAPRPLETPRAAVAAKPGGPGLAAFPAGEIVPRVACKASPELTYALYLPARYSPDSRWPILYCFDPRRHGSNPAELFRNAAEELGVILACSNDSRSDDAWEPNVEAMKAVWEDTHARFAIDPHRVYATGFSGGARTATALALARAGEVQGVIGCAGGFPGGQPPTAPPPFAFFGAAGRHDFNFSELRNLDRRLATMTAPHRFEPFDGEHQWCPPAIATEALRWMELLAMRDGRLEVAPRFVDEAWRAGWSQAQALNDAHDWVLAADRFAALAADFRGLHDITAAQSEAERLRSSPGYAQALAVEDSAEREAEDYLPGAAAVMREALSNVGEARLEAVLARLRVKGLQRTARERAGEYPGDAASRLLAVLYVQTAFYLPRDLMKAKDYQRAQFSLEVATRVRPDEPWGWFSLACARAPAGEKAGALDALRKAVDLGFDDAKLLSDEPALARVRDEKEFRALLARLQRKAAGG